MTMAEQAALLAADVAFWSLGLDDPETEIKEVGRLAQDLAPKFRALAILMLLSQGSLSIFFSNPLVGSLVSLALVMLLWPLLSAWKSTLRRQESAAQLSAP